MPEVFLINPGRKKRKSRAKTASKKRSVASRAKKRTTKRRTTARRATTMSTSRPKTTRRRTTTAKTKGVSTMTKKKRTKKRRYTKNPAPSRARRYGRRAAARVKSSILGLDIKGALMNTPYLLAGMLGTKWAAKRFGGGASEADPESWTWKSYLQGAIGAVATAFVANMVKRGSGKKVLEGGLALVAYDLIQNELIAGNEWASGQFGAADEYSYLPGDVESGPDGSVQMLGADYQWRELPEATMSGDVLQPPGRLGQLEPVTSLGETDAFRRAILG